MAILKFLIEKEFKQLVRNSMVPRMLLVMPLMMMVVMPFAANQEVKGVRVSVVDNDHSSYSQRLAQKVDASTYVSVEGYYPTYNDAIKSVEAGETDIILEIEDDFEKNFVNSNMTRVMISANSVNGTKGSLGSSYISSIMNDFSGDLRQELGVAGSQVGATSNAESFRMLPNFKFNPHLDYKTYMIPALMVMLLTILGGFLPALNIVSEKEIGTIEQINVTPVGKMTFIFAKLIPYWVIGFMILTFSMGLAALVHGLFPVGSLITIYLFASIYILVVSGMGLVVSNYSETMQQAMFVMFFFIMVFQLISGLFTPVSSMPEWAQWITKFNPLSYFVEVMRLVYLKGSGFSNLIPQFLALCGFAVFFSTWAVWSYKKSK